VGVNRWNSVNSVDNQEVAKARLAVERFFRGKNDSKEASGSDSCVGEIHTGS
jgi:hypothetical protein